MTQTDTALNATADVSLARRVLLLVCVIYPLWGAYCFWQFPGHHEPYWERVAIAAVCLVAWSASFYSEPAAARLPGVVVPIAALLTVHYLWIALINGLGAIYVIGVFITVGAVNGLLRHSRPLLAYSIVVLVASAALFFVAPGQKTVVALLLFGLVTLQLVALVAVSAQERAARRLTSAHSELDRRSAELERSNASLRAADRYKDDFLAIISHELRTPLNAIVGFGSILEDELHGPLNPTQHHDVKKIGAAADALLKLVNDLLDMSRIQAGKFALDPEPMALRDVIEDVVSGLAPLAAREGQSLRMALQDDLPRLVADPQRLRQVLTNLVGNAIKFNRAAGTVVVRAIAEADAVRCEVSDEGEGILPDDLGRLFQPFTQVDSSRTRKAGGTGLGLSISKALVEAHGGRIGVESMAERGSTFWFTIPLRAAVPNDGRRAAPELPAPPETAR